MGAFRRAIGLLILLALTPHILVYLSHGLDLL
jgi:hypothetical protein